MSKLTKREIQLHDQAVCLLQKEHLSHEDKLFIFENFREDAEHINSKSGAFFTPFGLANDFTLQIPCLYGKTIRIIDLCAGIGVLSYAAQLECSDRSRCYADITCVELNPHYVEVGKKHGYARMFLIPFCLTSWANLTSRLQIRRLAELQTITAKAT